MATFYSGDKTFSRSYFLSQLLLGQTGFFPFDFQAFPDDKRVAFHLELIPFSCPDRSEILRNEIFNRSKRNII